LVENIRVSFTEKDSSSAREVAINYGERVALSMLFKNIEISPSNSVLIKNNELQKAITSMQISGEKISNTSYSAYLNIEFNQNYISFLLNKYHINKFTPGINSYLIIPLYFDDKNMYLHEKDNISMPPFEVKVKNTSNMFVVKNDYYTKSSLNGVVENTKPQYNNFKGLFDYYNVNNIVFIFIRKDNDVFSNKFFIVNSAGVGEANLNYKGVRYDGAADKIIEYLKNLTTNNSEEKKENEILEEDYVKLFIKISSLKDFSDVEKTLGYNDYIISKTLKSLDKVSAIYHIKILNNDRIKFIESLKSVGFLVSEKKEGIYAFLQ
jgi:hypothetical protein